MSKNDREKAINAIAIGRIVVGSIAWLAPRQSGRLFGLDPEGNPQAPYLGRLFGARDVALLQCRDSVHQGRPDRLDAGDLETLARLCRLHGVGLSRLTEHYQGCEQTEAGVPKVPAQTRHCVSRDHCVLP